MKKLSYAFVLSAVLLSFGAPAAFACATQWYGPYFVGGPGGGSDYNYSLPTSCYTYGANVTPSTVGCSGATGWQLNGPHNFISASFTLDSSDPIFDPTKWTLGASIEASSAWTDGSDTITIQVSVSHPNGTWSYYTIYNWNSTMPFLCGGHPYGYFTANTGDTVNISISGKNTTGTATLKVSNPVIQNGD